MAESIVMPWTRVGPRIYVLDGDPDPHPWRGSFKSEKGPAQDMPGYIRRSIYSKRLSRGQHRYGVDTDGNVLDRAHIGATWRIRLNVHVWRRYGLISNYSDHLLEVRTADTPGRSNNVACKSNRLSRCYSPFTRCNRLSNRLNNRLYRVNGV